MLTYRKKKLERSERRLRSQSKNERRKNRNNSVSSIDDYDSSVTISPSFVSSYGRPEENEDTKRPRKNQKILNTKHYSRIVKMRRERMIPRKKLKRKKMMMKKRRKRRKEEKIKKMKKKKKEK